MRASALVVALLLTFTLPSTAAVLHVDADAPTGGDGSSWASAFTDLQDALAVATSGDQIWVAAGTYYPTTTGDRDATFDVPSGVSLYGGFAGMETHPEQRDLDAHESVLSADQSVFGFPDLNSARVMSVIDATERVVVDGFVFRGEGFFYPETDLDVFWHGGLIVERSSISLRNLVFDSFAVQQGGSTLGSTTAGGGAYFSDCDFVEISNVEAHDCLARFGSAFAFKSTSPMLDRVDIRDNGSLWTMDGAVYGDSSSLLSISNSVVQGNDAFGTAGVFGPAILENVVFRDNYTDEGDGASGYEGSGTLHNVLFVNNLNGSWEGPTMLGHGHLINVAFVDNRVHNGQFAVLITDGPTRLENCLVAASRSSDEAMLFRGPHEVEIDNTIIWGNRSWFEIWGGAERASPYTIDGATVTVRNSIVETAGGSGPTWDPSFGIDGGGNLDVDPRFVDPEGWNYRLRWDSPAIDAGNTALLTPDNQVDLDGNPRIRGAGVDMGPYEAAGTTCPEFEVTFGTSWDGVSLQEILDAEYGPGAIDVATDYEGARCGDAETPYWLDDSVDGWIIREVADFSGTNVLGWYREDLSGPPVIDGDEDGIIFDPSLGDGDQTFVPLPWTRRFGLYLDPNGPEDGTNAPQPELFFANRAYNDEGPDGSGALHPPEGGDAQALIFNITDLRNGVPTYVVAWEDIDSGSPLRETYAPGYTDNDYNDLVVEIRASSPVSIEDDDEETPTQVVSGLSLRVTPNPFNPVTSIAFSAPVREAVRVTVYDVRGREVEVLFDGQSTGAERRVSWSPTNVASGIYFVRLETENRILTEKVTLLR